MEKNVFTGALIRMLRLEKNWSQETLCQGICTVSYLSKIEQGRAIPNDAMLTDLFSKMGFTWQQDPNTQAAKVCEEAYEAIFSGNPKVTKGCKTMLMEPWEFKIAAPWYLDLMVLRAFYSSDPAHVPQQMADLLDERQSCLMLILNGCPEQAYKQYPCALAALEAGAKAYADGRYMDALEYLQRSYDEAARQGYVYLMMYSRTHMANCYSDLRNFSAMRSQYQVAGRLAKLLGEPEMSSLIDYHIASSQLECGDYEAAFAYFSNSNSQETLHLHKLAICLEKKGMRSEAMKAVQKAESKADDTEKKMLELVRYRLEHPEYLNDDIYGKMLLDTFRYLRLECPSSYARFHFFWVEEWCTANRQYRQLYEITRDFL